MAQVHIRMDSRIEHNQLMANLCRQAAAGLARQLDLTTDPKRRELLGRRLRQNEEQSEAHSKIVEELSRAPCSPRCRTGSEVSTD